MRVVLTQHVLDLTPGLSAWMLALAYQHAQATVCDFMNGLAAFFPHGSSFTPLRKTREGLVGGGRAGRRRQQGGVG